MPVRPDKVKLEANSAQILNATREEIGGNYKDQVPEALSVGDPLYDSAGNVVGRATQADATNRLHAIGDIIMTFQPHQNAFLSALVNRIGRVIITSKLYENPWAGFKKGLLETGETVEEIFVNLANPHQFDPELAETNVFKREIPDVRAVFHTMNYQKFYKTTVSNDQLRQAFLSWQGITDLISKIIESLYTSANFDEFLTMKYLIARMTTKGYLYPVNVPELTTDTARAFTTTLKGVSNSLEFMSTTYNQNGVATYTNKNDQFLIINAQASALLDVEVLALSFNMDKAEFLGHIIYVDSFAPSDSDLERLNLLFDGDPSYTPFTEEEIAALKTLPAVLVDRNWFMIFDNYYNMTEKYNGEGLYWNYWYHVWKTFSASTFNNAIAFTTETPGVTSVTVSPATATVAKGGNLQLTADVVTTGFASKGVMWTLSGTATPTSTITADGRLNVNLNESNTQLTVTAKSVYDNTKMGSATITVS